MNRKLILIMVRDMWQCQMPRCLCPDGRRIRKALLESNDPWAPSMDHILPKSAGGRAIPENLRAAHRHCNAVRGSGSFRDMRGNPILQDPAEVLGGKYLMKQAYAA